MIIIHISNFPYYRNLNLPTFKAIKYCHRFTIFAITCVASSKNGSKKCLPLFFFDL